MTETDLTSKLAAMISDLGGRFMTDPVGFGRADEMNVAPGIGVYIAGRFGVLGRVHADVVVASAVFIAPDLLTREWDTVMQTADPAKAAEVYLSIATEYGRAHISDAPDLDVWIEYAERVIDSASPLGAPIFAGWRAMPRPDDAPGRAYLLAHILRELRFSLHANALVAAGLDPLVATICESGVDDFLPVFGWTAPYPEPSEHDRQRRAAIDDTTNELSARTLGALDARELKRFVSITEGIIAAAV